jgi:hypothetical protein
MKTREYVPTLGFVRVCVSRGLSREVLGLWIFPRYFYGILVGCHSPFPEVAAVFGFFEVLWGSSSGGRFLV